MNKLARVLVYVLYIAVAGIHEQIKCVYTDISLAESKSNILFFPCFSDLLLFFVVLFHLFMFVSHNGEAYFEIILVVCVVIYILFFFALPLLLLLLLLVWFSRINIPRVFNAFGYGCYIHISYSDAPYTRFISIWRRKL